MERQGCPEARGATPCFIRQLEPVILRIINADTFAVVPCIADFTHDSSLVGLYRTVAFSTRVLPIDNRARVRLNIARENKDN